MKRTIIKQPHFLKPMPYTKTFVDYYDIFSSFRKANYAKTARKLDALLRKHNAKNILDVGSGTGRIAKLLNKKGYTVTGIDSSKEMIKYARTKYPEIRFERMKAQDFKLNRKFDAIIALDSVLTFIVRKKEFEQALLNMVSHLKKKGILYFDIAFTEHLIPQNFTDKFFVEVEKDRLKFRKENRMRREGPLIKTKMKIIENGKKVIEELHKHRIASEEEIIRILTGAGCNVRTKGNRIKEKGNADYKPLEVIAEKL